MIYILKNLLPIGVATLLGLAIGWAFVAFFELPAPSVGIIALIVLCEFWLAAILAGALILAPDKAGPWAMALGTAFIIWIGFVAPTFVVCLAIARLKWWAILGIVLHWLVVMLVQTVAMKAIGLQAPPDGDAP